MIKIILNNLQMLSWSLAELRGNIVFWFHDQDIMITANQVREEGKVSSVSLLGLNL